jgi:uncharacterized protein YndB with AHSA1/START domain
MATVRKEITIAAPRLTVWQYFEDPDLIAAWLMRNNFSGKVGERFEFFGPPGNGWNGVLECRLVEFEPPQKLSYTWDANDIGGETLVTIELFESAAGTTVCLVHSQFERASLDVESIVRRHDEGWADHLRVLASQLLEAERGGQSATRPVDWTRFELHCAIGAEPENVLGMWCTIRGMESCF